MEKVDKHTYSCQSVKSDKNSPTLDVAWFVLNSAITFFQDSIFKSAYQMTTTQAKSFISVMTYKEQPSLSS